MRGTSIVSGASSGAVLGGGLTAPRRTGWSSRVPDTLERSQRSQKRSSSLS